MDRVDTCIVGGGVIGLACARQLAGRTGTSGGTVVLEQDGAIGRHTSSRNSEVIHAGIYYPGNSLKARLCVRGRELLYQYCRQHRVPHRPLGKLIIARQGEETLLEGIRQRALANGVADLEALDAGQLRRLEPEVRGAAALLSPSTGILDSHQYLLSLLHQAQNRGAELALYTRLERALPLAGGGFLLQLSSGREAEPYRLQCRRLINAAGLQAQAVAAAIEGLDPAQVPPLYPCKGDYFLWGGPSPVCRLLYPLPETNVQGLGIHGTLDMAGQLRFGPDSEYVECLDYRVEPGKAARFADAVRPYLPAIRPERLQPAYAGIRPKLAGGGEPQADFCIQDHNVHGIPGLVQLFGIESPGLTASLAIAEMVARSL